MYGAPNVTFSTLFSRHLTRLYEILIRNYELIFWNYEILIRNYEILIRFDEILIADGCMASYYRSWLP
jgi:hypothetical protein